MDHLLYLTKLGLVERVCLFVSDNSATIDDTLTVYFLKGVFLVCYIN
jgi:hypothetical protein